MLLPLPGDQGQGLDGFTQPHIIGQTGPQTPLPQKIQPGIAFGLIRPQASLKIVRRRQLLQAGLARESGQKIAQPTLRGNFCRGQAG